MNAPRRDSIARLLAALPPMKSDTELILRPGKGNTVAMLRPTDSAPRAFAATDDAVIELQPHEDPKLPAAPLLADERKLALALEPYLGKIGDPRLIAWRPRRRAVVRLARGDETLFVKFLDAKAYRRATAVFSALADAPTPLRFARPIALIDDLQAYVAGTAPGRSLREHLAAGLSPDWKLVEASLRALARTETRAELPRHDFFTARDAAAKMLRKAAVLGSHYADLATRVEQVTPPTSEAAGFVHGDLHDKQIFLTDDRSWLIDLEGIGQGDANFDLVNLAEHLRLRALQRDNSEDHADAQLLDRFGLSHDHRLRWRLAVRARICAVYALRPRWAVLTSRLMTETEQLLVDLA